MVETVNLILISASAGAFVIAPLIPFIYMILKNRTKPMLSGMSSFIIYGIVMKNFVFFLIFLLPFLKASLYSDQLIYALVLGVVSALLHLLTRHMLDKKKKIKDICSFSTGESFVQCIYMGIPTSVLALIYALIINLGGFEYIGMTEKLMPVATSLINAESAELLPYIIYPFFVFSQNWLTLIIFTRNRILSASIEAAIISIYSYMMLNKFFIMNFVFMSVFVIATLLIFILIMFNSKKRKKDYLKA